MNQKIFIIAAAIMLLIIASIFLGYQYYNKPSFSLAPEQTFPPVESRRDSGAEMPALRIPDLEEEIIIFPPETKEKLLDLEVPVLPVPGPKSEEIQKIRTPYAEDFLKRLQEAVLAAEKEIKERSVAAPTSTASGASKQEISTAIEEIKLPLLSPEEFHFLYPDWFVKSLKEAQNLLISYDQNYQPAAEIQTDADVRYIQEKIVSALFSADMLTKEEAERYLTTIRFTLPQLQLMELGSYQLKIKETTQGSSGRFLERIFLVTTRWPRFAVAFFGKALFPERVAVIESPKQFLVYGLIEKLKQIVVIPTSEAGGGGGPCGFCYTLPECFQERAPAPIGMNTWTAFCYCTGCLFGQGCLDRCAGQSAIWDPTTGICGCG